MEEHFSWTVVSQALTLAGILTGPPNFWEFFYGTWGKDPKSSSRGTQNPEKTRKPKKNLIQGDGSFRAFGWRAGWANIFGDQKESKLVMSNIIYECGSNCKKLTAC